MTAFSPGVGDEPHGGSDQVHDADAPPSPAEPPGSRHGTGSAHRRTRAAHSTGPWQATRRGRTTLCQYAKLIGRGRVLAIVNQPAHHRSPRGRRRARHDVGLPIGLFMRRIADPAPGKAKMGTRITPRPRRCRTHPASRHRLGRGRVALGTRTGFDMVAGTDGVVPSRLARQLNILHDRHSERSLRANVVARPSSPWPAA